VQSPSQADARRALFLDTVIVALAALARFTIGLGDEAIRNWDEGLYCAATRDMLREENLLFPVVNGAFDAYYGKPPFVNWLHLISTSIFGFTPFGLRLPSALASTIAVLLSHRVATRMGGRAAGAFAAAVLLLSLPFAEFGRQNLLEPILAALALASLHLHAIAIERRSTMVALAAGVLVGLAILTKQLVGALPFCAVLVAEVALRREGAWKRTLAHLVGLLVASAWWFVWVRAIVGPELEASLIDTHLIKRAAGEFETHGRHPLDYGQNLSMFFWTIPVIAGAVGGLRAIGNPQSRLNGTLLAAFAFGHYLLFGVISKNFLPWYVVYAVPALVVLASVLFGRGSSFWMRALLAGSVGAGLGMDAGGDPVLFGLIGVAVAVPFEWRPIPDRAPTFLLLACFALSALVLRPRVVREPPEALVAAVDPAETLVLLDSWMQFVWKCYLPAAEFAVSGSDCTDVRRLVSTFDRDFVITAPEINRCELHQQGYYRVALYGGFVVHRRPPDSAHTQ
jgi:4-amino-4-deoxy-L-arabinose transferase-like glycosyltransferase